MSSKWSTPREGSGPKPWASRAAPSTSNPVRFSLQPGSLFACTLAISAASGNTLFEAGYSQMYNIQFADAPRTFQEWEGAHPNDPMGPVSDAAAYLFSEFDRLRI